MIRPVTFQVIQPAAIVSPVRRKRVGAFDADAAETEAEPDPVPVRGQRPGLAALRPRDEDSPRRSASRKVSPAVLAAILKLRPGG